LTLSRRRFTQSSAAVLAATLAGRSRSASAQSEVTLRIGASPEEDMLPAVYAGRSGIFRRHGLDVRLTVGTAGPALAAGVAGGALDVGKSSLLSLIVARTRGVQFVLVAPGGMYDSTAANTMTLVGPDSPLRSPRDLAGKTVAVASLRGQSQIITMAFVDKAGGDSKDVKFVELPQSAAPAALVEHRVDAATMSTPWIADAIGKGCRSLGNSGDAIANRYLNTGYFCMAEFGAKNRAALVRLAQALEEAGTYTNAHPGETAPLVAEYTNVPLATIQRMTRQIAGTRLQAREVQPVIDVAARYGAIAAPFDAATMLL
jgi:NitT/TauT family transport system substrate-binding protein